MRPMVTLVSVFAITLATAFAQDTPAATKAFTLSSQAFAAGGEIPPQYTCKGPNSSPPLQWSNAPANAVSFALIVDDPDAPGSVWVHWVLWNLPATAQSLPEGVPKKDQLEDGSVQGRNDFHKAGYNGPCPPGSSTHRYFFRLYALDSKLSLPAGTNRTGLDAAMKGHILSQSEFMGTFHK